MSSDVGFNEALRNQVCESAVRRGGVCVVLNGEPEMALRRIAGALEPGDRVVVTEDTVTRGTSVMEAVAVVRGAGAEVVLITAIVDRGGTCAALADAAGIAYRPLLTAADLGFAPGS